ncbi:SRPBCC domain-containing protein [Pedobacter sp. UC225_65]|uniref:SRPBCC family protein n=1 Tax=Pedobacter sp. UC225_65 TaxID=3350173 RepID=UPI00366FC09D
MENFAFKIEINATRERVWDILFGAETYPLWTAVFSEGSHAETDWKKGSRALFLGSEGKGMVSRIEESTPYSYLSITHLGMYDNGVEDFDSEEVKKWAGAIEDYTLTEVGGQTLLTIDMSITAEFEDYFQQTWPKALAKVKELAEQAEVIPPVVV